MLSCSGSVMKDQLEQPTSEAKTTAVSEEYYQKNL